MTAAYTVKADAMLVLQQAKFFSAEEMAIENVI